MGSRALVGSSIGITPGSLARVLAMAIRCFCPPESSSGKDYSIHIEPDTFHAYPAFTFTPEGRKGEQQVIDYIKEKMSR